MMKAEAAFSHLVVLNLEYLVWYTCTLTTRPLLHKLCKLLLVFCPAEIELYFKYINMKYSKYEVYFKYTLGDILISKVCDTEK